MLANSLHAKSTGFKTDALTNMDKLKLLQLNFVELTGSMRTIRKIYDGSAGLGST